METRNHDHPIAVIWYDGSQEHRVDVVPGENTADTTNNTIIDDSSSCIINIPDGKVCGDIHNGIRNSEIISSGVDNTGFDKNAAENDCSIEPTDEITVNCSSCGNNSGTRSTKKKSNKITIKRTPRCLSPRAFFRSISNNSSSNIDFSHSNPSFEMPYEYSYDAVVYSGFDKKTAENDCSIHPTEEITANCSSCGNSSGTRSTKKRSNKISIIRTSRLSPRAFFRSISNNSSSNIDFSRSNPSFEMPYEYSYDAVVKSSSIHRNTYLVQNKNILACTNPSNDVIIQLGLLTELENKDTCNASDANTVFDIHTTNINWDGQSHDDNPPPSYSSLRFLFVEDEPPRYEDVTGKKLAMEYIHIKVRRRISARWKCRALVIIFILFILLILALLVYACFVSAHTL